MHRRQEEVKFEAVQQHVRQRQHPTAAVQDEVVSAEQQRSPRVEEIGHVDGRCEDVQGGVDDHIDIQPDQIYDIDPVQESKAHA